MVQFKKQNTNKQKKTKKMMDKIQDLKTVLDKSVGDVLTASSIDKVFKKKKKTQIFWSFCHLRKHIGFLKWPNTAVL